MTARKTAAPTVVVTPEPWVLNAGQVGARIGRSAGYVLANLVDDNGQPVAAKDVPAQLGSEAPTVWFDLGGGVLVACWRGPKGAVCFYRAHAEAAIVEARKRWNHPAGRER